MSDVERHPGGDSSSNSQRPILGPSANSPACPGHPLLFIGTVVFVVNGAMPYEFPILKNELFHFFPEAIERYSGDFKRQDAYLRAQSVMDFLEPLRTAVDESRVPSRSLFREFIRGSEYVY